MSASTMESVGVVTRSDFDGLVCAILLKELDLTRSSSSSEGHAGRVDDDRDITTNLPYVAGRTWPSTITRAKSPASGIRPTTTSSIRTPLPQPVSCTTIMAAQALSGIAERMLEAVDKADSAQFNRDDISRRRAGSFSASSWIPHRPGPLRRIPHLQLPAHDGADRHVPPSTIADVPELPDVKERVTSTAITKAVQEQIQRCSTVHKNLVVLDLRDEETIWAATASSSMRCSRSATSPSTALGPQEAKHGVRHGKVHLRPQQDQHRPLMLSTAAAATKPRAPARSPTRRRTACSKNWCARVNADG